MIVVSNTSPIINLAAVGKLELLQHLYGSITIPQAAIMKSPLEAPDSQALAKSKPPCGLSGTMYEIRCW